jgi:DNA repair exonuclease SbcCD ATPase subunit
MSEDNPISNAAATPAPRPKKQAKAPSPSNGAAPRQNDAERAQQRLEERLRPHIEKLMAAAPSEFQKVLEAIAKKLKEEKVRREDRYYLLRAALRHIPPEQSGVILVKHFKSSSEWTTAEIEAALHEVTAALRERNAELARMGPFVHGALISLIDAARKQEGPDGSGGEKVDLVAALLQLHAVTWDPQREPLRGLPEPPVSKVLAQTSELLRRFASRPDVQAIAAQRLFGFGEVFVAQPPIENVLPAATQSPPKLSSESTGSEAGAGRGRQEADAQSALVAPLVPTVQPPASIADDPLRKELALLRKQLELAKRDSNTLRRERDQEREASSELRWQLKMVGDMRDGLSETVRELQAKLEIVAQLQARLAEQQEIHRVATAEIDRLRELLKVSEVQARLAMESEFQRGKTSARFTIVKYFVEPLRQMSDAASSIEGDSGQFVRDMANSLRKYLEEGRG